MLSNELNIDSVAYFMLNNAIVEGIVEKVHSTTSKSAEGVVTYTYYDVSYKDSADRLQRKGKLPSVTVFATKEALINNLLK